MKKLFAITLMMVLAISGFAQQLHYDFSETVESGQTLYFLKGYTENPYELTVTYPCQNGTNNFYYGYDKPVGNLIIPSTLIHNDTIYTIVGIGSRAFYNCNGLTSITLPYTLSFLQQEAFAGCTGINGELVIPDPLRVINSASFQDCTNIKSVVFGSSLETIAHSAFKGCSSLEHLSSFPASLTGIYQNAFENCVNLCGTIVIPAQVNSINQRAFANCNIDTLILSEGVVALKDGAFLNCPISHLYIPSTLVSINGENAGEGAFHHCSKLQSITVDEANPVYDSRGNCNALIETATNTLLKGSKNTVIPNSVSTIGENAFLGCIDLETINIPYHVEQIEYGAFSGCNQLRTVTLPSSVSYIADRAFSCGNMTSIICKSFTPPTAFNHYGYYAFFNSFLGTPQDIPVYVPIGTGEAYRQAEGWDWFSNIMESEMYFNGEWYYKIENEDGNITYQYLQCEGDTTINNERPKIIVRTNTIYDKDKKTEVTHEYVYENNGIVYWWNKELQQFTTLYDLTAEEGDEWEIKVGTETLLMHVDGVEAYEHDGETYTMLHVSDAGDVFTGDIVVGIGHLTSFFPERLMNKNKGFRVDGLRCYWVGDALLYHQGDEDCDAIHSNFHGVDEINTEGFQVYPNPTDGLLYIVETQNIASIPLEYHITNLLGQTVMSGTLTDTTIDISSLPDGLYFFTIDNHTVKLMKQ